MQIADTAAAAAVTDWAVGSQSQSLQASSHLQSFMHTVHWCVHSVWMTLLTAVLSPSASE